MSRCGDLLILLSPKANLVCKFYCLLKLPPTNLEWPASFFSFSLSSVYGIQVQILPFPRLQTKTLLDKDLGKTKWDDSGNVWSMCKLPGTNICIYFLHIISFNPNPDHEAETLNWYPIKRRQNWGAVRLNKWSKVTQYASRVARTRA